jgi:hypothetical protein
MQRWRDYFHGLIASERAATAELVSAERDFQWEVVGTTSCLPFRFFT